MSFVALVAFSVVASGQDEEAPKLLTTYHDLVDLLNQDSVSHKPNDEKRSVRIPTKRENLDALKPGPSILVPTSPRDFSFIKAFKCWTVHAAQPPARISRPIARRDCGFNAARDDRSSDPIRLTGARA